MSKPFIFKMLKIELTLNQFLNVAFEGKTPNQYEQENGRSSFDLLTTLKKLEGYHKDFFVVFAHVEQSSGLWKGLDGEILSNVVDRVHEPILN